MRVVAKVIGWLLLVAAGGFAVHGAYLFFAHFTDGARPGSSIAAGAPLAMLGMLALRWARGAGR